MAAEQVPLPLLRVFRRRTSNTFKKTWSGDRAKYVWYSLVLSEAEAYQN